MSDKSFQDFVYNKIPAIALALVGVFWLSTIGGLKETDRDHAIAMKDLAETVMSLQIEVAKMGEHIDYGD